MIKKNLVIAWFIIGTLAVACKNNENKAGTASSDSTAVASDTTKKTVYACPMDPDITSDQPGQCSKCGMDLVIKNQ